MDVIMSAIGMVSGVVTLFFLFYKPMNSHSLAVKENTMTTKANTKAFERLEKKVDEELREIRANQKESLSEIKREKQESHRKIWAHEEKQDEILEKHSVSIKVIQERIGIDER